MATDGIIEVVNEGHNILNTGFGLTYDANSKSTKLIYRSREGLSKGGGNDHFLASTELGKSTGWVAPAQVTKTGQFDEQDAKEFLAYVVPADKPTSTSEFVFSVIDNTLNMRTRKDSSSTWSNNTAISDTNLVKTNIVATSIGPTLIVYGWDMKHKLVEFTCNVAAADKPWKSAVAVPDMPTIAKGVNSKLGVTRTEKGICLLFSGAEQQIWWRHRDAGGKWGAGKAIITKEVHTKSPMAIMVIPYFPPPKILTCPIPSEPPQPIHCHPVPVSELGKVPKVEDPGKCNERFAVAYVDINYTAQVQQINDKGASTGTASRISRINAQTGNDRSGIFSVFIIPGVYPQTLTVVAISALHGRETLFTLSLVAPRQLVKNTAKSSALLEAALAQLNARFTAFDKFHDDLVVAQAWLKDNLHSKEYVARAAGRDHTAVRYLLAGEEWNAAREAAWLAQITAINDYNAMVLSCYVSHMRPIKTEVRTIVDGNAVFPPVAEGQVLPDLN